MTLDVQTIVAVSLMMAVFSAVAAVGTSLVLGAGFERLRNGFEVVRKQSGFFSDAIHKLEQKVEIVDTQAHRFSASIHALESKVTNVGEQANAFCDAVGKLEKKVEIVDRQSGFFSDALHTLESRLKAADNHAQAEDAAEIAPQVLSISTDKSAAMGSQVDLLLGAFQTSMPGEAAPGMFTEARSAAGVSPAHLEFFAAYGTAAGASVRYH